MHLEKVEKGRTSRTTQPTHNQLLIQPPTHTLIKMSSFWSFNLQCICLITVLQTSDGLHCCSITGIAIITIIIIINSSRDGKMLGNVKLKDRFVRRKNHSGMVFFLAPFVHWCARNRQSLGKDETKKNMKKSLHREKTRFWSKQRQKRRKPEGLTSQDSLEYVNLIQSGESEKQMKQMADSRNFGCAQCAVCNNTQT